MQKKASIGTFPGQWVYSHKCRQQGKADQQTGTSKSYQMPRSIVRSMLLWNGNTDPHMATHVVETIEKLGFQLLEYPTYNPGTTPSKKHLFESLTHLLPGHQFATDKEAHEAMHR